MSEWPYESSSPYWLPDPESVDEEPAPTSRPPSPRSKPWSRPSPRGVSQLHRSQHSIQTTNPGLLIGYRTPKVQKHARSRTRAEMAVSLPRRAPFKKSEPADVVCSKSCRTRNAPGVQENLEARSRMRVYIYRLDSAHHAFPNWSADIGKSW